MSSILNERLIYEILSVVEEIPKGNVASYGQIASLIGRSKNARLVGKVLSRSEWYGDYPCHRVVNHAGRTAPGFPCSVPCSNRRELNSRQTAVWICAAFNGSANSSWPLPGICAVPSSKKSLKCFKSREMFGSRSRLRRWEHRIFNAPCAICAQLRARSGFKSIDTLDEPHRAE